MTRVRACLDCGAPTTAARCEDCSPRHGVAAGFRRVPRQPTYDTAAWRRLSKRLRAEHVERYGWWCPGLNRAGHPSTDLTVDHIVALVEGGAPLNPANLRVACRSCNGRAGLALVARRRWYQAEQLELTTGGGLNP